MLLIVNTVLPSVCKTNTVQSIFYNDVLNPVYMSRNFGECCKCNLLAYLNAAHAFVWKPLVPWCSEYKGKKHVLIHYFGMFEAVLSKLHCHKSLAKKASYCMF